MHPALSQAGGAHELEGWSLSLATLVLLTIIWFFLTEFLTLRRFLKVCACIQRLHARTEGERLVIDQPWMHARTEGERLVIDQPWMHVRTEGERLVIDQPWMHARTEGERLVIDQPWMHARTEGERLVIDQP